jgi:transcriptional regulator with XRE-family HTH domain
MPKKKSMPDVLRDLIRADGRTRYEIGKLSGVSQGILGRFMRNERDMNLRTAGKLCEVLGVELRRVRRRKGLS